MFERIILSVIRLRRFFLTGLILMVLAMGFFAAQIKVDNSIDVWFVKNDPTLLNYREFQKEFGNDEVVVVAFQDENTIFSGENLGLIEAVSDRLKNIAGVARVLSLNQGLHIRLNEDKTNVDPLNISFVPTSEAIAQLRERALSDPLLVRRLISTDGRTTLLLIYLRALNDIDARRDSILNEIKQALDHEFAKRQKIYRLAGVGVVYNALNQLTLRDAGIFLPISFLIVTVLLWFLLRHLGAVMIALAIVGSATIILMGFYALAGKSLNQVTTILPTLLLIIGIAESLHIFTEYFQASAHTSHPDKNKRIAQSIAAVALPCLFTTITTVIGFLSLTTAPVAILKDFGLFGALGFLIEFVLALTVSAIGFSFLNVPTGTHSDSCMLSSLVNTTERVTRHYRIAVLVVSSAVVLFSLIGLFRLRVDTDSIGLLRSDHSVRVDSEFIEKNFGYYTPLEFVVHASDRDGIKSIDVLQKIEAWQKRIEADPRVSNTFALTDALKHINQVLHESAPDEYKLPATSESLAAALTFSARTDPTGLKPYVNDDFTLARVTVSIKMTSAEGIRNITQDLLAQSQGLFSSNIEVKASGYLPLYVNLIDYLTRGQISSFALAFPLIFIFIGVFLRSAKLALLAIVPNLFPILLTLGVMGWLKIPLDIATVTIASIILGIVVDDTVHFLYGYKKAQSAYSPDEALSIVMQSTGRAMISTALILSSGFLVLALSSVKSIVYFGLLSSIALIAAVLGDLLIMAALLLTLRMKI